MLRLDLVVGPNGSGKSTFVRLTLIRVLPSGVAFVNADEIAQHRWPSDPASHAYDAAKVAARTRAALIAAGQPLIAETVFSHPSKLDLIDEAHAAGYTVSLHVLLLPAELAVSRVAHRVGAGGHSVPEDKIRQRYEWLWPLVVTAMTRSDAATVYDNSGISGPRIVAQLAGGAPVGALQWPAWAPEPLRAAWPRT
ncbi:MAG: zeta toxin family protein [Actinomycetota bacterium]|nr:zeta toxin family protein [Actinomycetota bacterium]